MPLQMNGVEAWITVGDKVHAQEFAVDLDEDSGVATCWIGGEPGETFAIRWRDLSDPIANPNFDAYGSYNVPPRDLSGFVMMDGYELGGRVLHARSHASAIFSRIATSPTSCVPLTFSSLPASAGLGEDWTTLGTISLDIHVVQIGEANRLHEGYSSYYRRDEAPPLSSATPFSSTEVTSVRKIATFVFKYRPLDVLRSHPMAPLTTSATPVEAAMAMSPTTPMKYVHVHVPPVPVGPRVGDKRRTPHDDFSDEELSPIDQEMRSPTLVFGSNSDSDSSQDFTKRARPMRPTVSRVGLPPLGCGLPLLQLHHQQPLAKRIKL